MRKAQAISAMATKHPHQVTAGNHLHFAVFLEKLVLPKCLLHILVVTSCLWRRANESMHKAPNSFSVFHCDVRPLPRLPFGKARQYHGAGSSRRVDPTPTFDMLIASGELNPIICVAPCSLGKLPILSKISLVSQVKNIGEVLYYCSKARQCCRE